MREQRTRRVAVLWEEFRDKVIAVNAPQIQKDQMMLAFYSGAWALFMKIMTFLDDGHEATEEDLRMVSEIDEELRQFAAAFQRANQEKGREN